MSRWVIHHEVSSGLAYIQSKNTGLIDIPQSAWQYDDGTNWADDNTLTITGNNKIAGLVTMRSCRVLPRKIHMHGHLHSYAY